MAAALTVQVRTRLPGGFILRAGLVLGPEPAITVLFGPSGSGKTSLLRAIAGLDRPQSGTIRAGDITWLDDSTCLPPQRRQIGYIQQDDALFPHLSLRDNALFALRSLQRHEAFQRVLTLFDALGIAELADRLPSQVSGGQRQRASLARTLATQPRLLLLDEPLSALDIPSREDVRLQLRRILAGLKIHTILVTHDRADAIALGDFMAVMINGEIRQHDRTPVVFSRPADPDVARLLGVETLVEGTILSTDRGMALIRVGPIELSAVCDLPAEDLTLHKHAPEAQSARNHLSGRVSSIDSDGPRVRVGIDCGFPMVATITRPAAEDLALVQGSPIVASIKASAIHLIAR